MRALNLCLCVGLAAVASGATGCQPPRYEDYAPGQASFVRGGEALAQEGEPIPLVAVDQRLVTLEDFLRRLEALPEWDQQRLQSAPARELLLEGLQGMLVLAAEAEAAGMEADPMVQAAVAEATAHQVVGREASETPLPPITDEAIAERYQERRFMYVRPASARLYLLVVEDTEQAAALRRDARQAQRELALGERVDQFAALARERSLHAPSRERGGDLGFLDADQVAERFGEGAVADLVDNIESVGRIYGPFPSQEGGAALVLVAELREPYERDLEAVSGELRAQLEAEQRAAARAVWLERARAEAGIEYDDAALALLREPPAPAVAPVEPAPIEGMDEVSLDALLNPVYDLSALPLFFEPGASDGSGAGAPDEGSGAGAPEGTGMGSGEGSP